MAHMLTDRERGIRAGAVAWGVFILLAVYSLARGQITPAPTKVNGVTIEKTRVTLDPDSTAAEPVAGAGVRVGPFKAGVYNALTGAFDFDGGVSIEGPLRWTCDGAAGGCVMRLPYNTVVPELPDADADGTPDADVALFYWLDDGKPYMKTPDGTQTLVTTGFDTSGLTAGRLVGMGDDGLVVDSPIALSGGGGFATPTTFNFGGLNLAAVGDIYAYNQGASAQPIVVTTYDGDGTAFTGPSRQMLVIEDDFDGNGQAWVQVGDDATGLDVNGKRVTNATNISSGEVVRGGNSDNGSAYWASGSGTLMDTGTEVCALHTCGTSTCACFATFNTVAGILTASACATDNTANMPILVMCN